MRVSIALILLVASMLDRVHCQVMDAEDSLTLSSEGSGQSADTERPSDSNWLLTSSDHPLKLSQQSHELSPHVPLLLSDAANKDQWTTPKAAVDQPSLPPIRAGHPSDVHTLTPDRISIRIPQTHSSVAQSAPQPANEIEAAVVRLCRVLGQCQTEIVENDMVDTSIVEIEELNSEPVVKDTEHFIYPSTIKTHFATAAKTSNLPSGPVKSGQLTDKEDVDLSQLESKTESTPSVSDDAATTAESVSKTTRPSAAIYNRYRINSNPVVKMPTAISITQRPKLSEVDRSNRRLPSPKMPATRRNVTATSPMADNSTTDPRISYSPSYVQVSSVTINDSEGRSGPSTEPTATTAKVTSLAGHPNFHEFLKYVQYSYHASPVLTSGYASVKQNN